MRPHQMTWWSLTKDALNVLFVAGRIGAEVTIGAFLGSIILGDVQPLRLYTVLFSSATFAALVALFRYNREVNRKRRPFDASM